MKTSRIEFGSGILMSEGSHGFNGMLWRRCQRGCSLNSSRSWIESGLELFRMGRAFLGGVWCPGGGWGLQHPQSQQGELRSGGMGASSSKREGEGEAPTAGMAGSPKLAMSPKLAISVTPRWDYGSHSPRSCSQHRGNSGKPIPPQWLFPASLPGAALALPVWKLFPFRKSV